VAAAFGRAFAVLRLAMGARSVAARSCRLPKAEPVGAAKSERSLHLG
jgi:hypothetical protein